VVRRFAPALGLAGDAAAAVWISRAAVTKQLISALMNSARLEIDLQ
jgi:hypothetical protein